MSFKTDLIKYKTLLSTLKVQVNKFNFFDFSSFKENYVADDNNIKSINSFCAALYGAQQFVDMNTSKFNYKLQPKIVNKNIYLTFGNSISPFDIKEIDEMSSDIPLCITGEKDVLNYSRKAQYVSKQFIENNTISADKLNSISDYGFYDGTPTNAHGLAVILIPDSFMSDINTMKIINDTLNKYIPANINYTIITDTEGL